MNWDNHICRAKDLNGHWREGYYVRHEKRQPCVIGGDELKDDEVEHYIFFDGFADWNMPRELKAIEVNPDTVCMYSGMTDKHGKRIFENDVVKKRTYMGIKPCQVYFSNGCFHCGYGGGSSTATHPYLLDDKNIEVIGNVFDNPMALEGK